MNLGLGLKLLERPPQVEAALWRRLRYEQEAKCRAQLFDHYAAFARAIARHESHNKRSHTLDRADYEQLAYAGLLEAIDKYDPLLGAPFKAFARHRIRGAIADGVFRSSENAAQFSARRRLEDDRLRSIMTGSGKSEDAIAQLTALAAALALGLVLDRAGRARADLNLQPYEGAVWRDMQRGVLDEIASLPDPGKTILEQHYMNDVPFHQLGKLLGLSKGRIAQLHSAALKQLRARMRRQD